MLLKGLFIAAILGGMAWLLRYLFGPGGPLRDKEFDEPDPETPRTPASKTPDASRLSDTAGAPGDPERPRHE